MAWYALSTQQVAERLATDIATGLSDAQAAERVVQYGRNELHPPPPISPWALLFEQFTDFIVLVLIGAAIISAALAFWSHNYEELINPAAILAIVILNAVLGFFQEYRAERALAALRQLAAPNARVIRAGESRRIPAAELVPGDLIELVSGDIIPADARIVQSVQLRMDEAPLTGESTPVDKFAQADVAPDAPIDARVTLVHAGTVVLHGRGRAIVALTGMQTELGQIATLVAEIKEDETPLQRRLDQVGRFLVYISFAIVAIIFPIGLLRGNSVFDMLLVAVSLAVAAVPEGLAAVVTIALALGLHRMIRRNALIRRLPAVETLGAATVICTDKTGTLTEGQMMVREIALPDRMITIGGEGFSPEGQFFQDAPTALLSLAPENDAALRLALTVGALCNASHLIQREDGRLRVVGDPTEGALLVAAVKGHVTPADLASEYEHIAEYPFDPVRKRMSVVCKRRSEYESGDEPYYAFVKGAPDLLFPLCTRLSAQDRVMELDAQRRAALAETNVGLALQARRVLALAYRRMDQWNDQVPASEIEKDLIFVGLAAMMDPPRAEVKQAVAEAQRAGIRVVMITGDHAATASAVARELNIARAGDETLTGADLDRMSDEELAAQVEHVSTYARVSPEDKLRIVRAWKAHHGNIVAMTGDGINDAPALKEAAIGIAMGVKGTDVAKEASDMVLTDDNFASIVAAIEEGRAIYDNIRKFIHYLLSGNIGEVLTVFLGPILGLPLPLLPIQILWMNLTTDSLPALALGVEKSEPNIMERPPRPADEPVIGRKLLPLMLVQGLFIGLVQFAGFVAEYYWLAPGDLDRARSVTLYLCIFAQNLHAFNIRSQKLSIFQLGLFSNPWLIYSFLSVTAITILTAYVPLFNAILQTKPIGLAEWGVIIGLAILPVIAMEIYKAVRRRVDRGIRKQVNR
ncbi:MAG: cation-translocating P-type ATPase [Anaerolineae bacterium]